MFCIVSFIVLSILGIFSASNRRLAREALDCVFRRLTLRPCNTGFDEKMKAKILGVVITRSERAAAFLNKRFEVLAWIFFVILMASSIMGVRGLYLFYTTGSCEGLNSPNFCVFDPTGANNEVSSSGVCKANQESQAPLSLEGLDLSSFPERNPDSPDQIVMIACYHCEYSRKAYPLVYSLAEHYGANLIFLHYPVKEPTDYFSRLAYCVYQADPVKFWDFNEAMFSGKKEQLDDPAYIQSMLTGLGLDAFGIDNCTSSLQTRQAVDAQLKEIARSGFYGTPTVFIGKEALVGPKPYRVYAIALKGLLYWLK